MSHKTVAEMNGLFYELSEDDAIWEMVSLKFDFLLYLFFKFFDISGS